MQFESAMNHQSEPLRTDAGNNPSATTFYETHRAYFPYDTKNRPDHLTGSTTEELLDEQSEQYQTEISGEPEWRSGEKYRSYLAPRQNEGVAEEFYTRSPIVCCSNVTARAEGSHVLETHFYECPDVTQCDGVQGGCL